MTAIEHDALEMAKPSITDQQREDMIVWASVRMANARTAQERREAWNDLKLLVTGRSRARVAQMELERGLR